jgi:hypothetical protein
VTVCSRIIAATIGRAGPGGDPLSRGRGLG